MIKLIKKLVEKHQKRQARKEYERKAERLYYYRRLRQTARIDVQ